MIDARRIILPIKAIKPVLSRLHAGHPGQEKTMALAQQLYYWQNMTNDIKEVPLLTSTYGLERFI